MGQFFKYLLASCLGVILATFILFSIGTAIVAGIASQADKPKVVKPNSVLHLTFDKPIPEQTNNVEVSPFEIERGKVLGLHDIERILEKAKEDDNIKGVLLEVDGLAVTGISMASNLRDAIRNFQSNGKFVVAYSKFYTQGAYYVSSGADKIYVSPLGAVDFRGFAAQVPFFKNMLDKIGVEMQIFYAGKFKSATEPYRRTDMSDENRFQTRAYLNDIYADFLRELSQTRGIPENELRRLADTYAGGSPDEALKSNLIDAVGYRDEALQDLRSRLGLEEEDKIPLITLNDYYLSNPPTKDYSVRDKIAVIYAEGTILDGKGENATIGDEKYMKIIHDIRRDEDIQAIVLRVNSPGGSALASENIWRELKLTRQEGKPIVVSMGDYAASGGYYISVASDTIFAEPKTLTGSIGVFLMIPNARELLGDKLGINFDTVKTSEFAVGFSPFHPLSPAESQYLKNRTDMMYETFLKRVAEGREMPRDSIHEIAQGRVWSGHKALEIGLVDRLGGLEDAIRSAAQLAGLEDYRLTEYPRIKDPLQELLERVMGMDEETQAQVRKTLLKNKYPEWHPYLKYLEEIRKSKGAQARLPFFIPFN